MTMTLAHKTHRAILRKHKHGKVLTGKKKADFVREYLENLVEKNKGEEIQVLDKQRRVFVFKDNSAFIFFEHKDSLGNWYDRVDYYCEFNDYSVNQGFPVGSDKKDFVEGAVIEVMFNDSPPKFGMILDVSQFSKTTKGDVSLRVFFFEHKYQHSITQTQIKRLVNKDIEDVLMSSAFV